MTMLHVLIGHRKQKYLLSIKNRPAIAYDRKITYVALPVIGDYKRVPNMMDVAPKGLKVSIISNKNYKRGRVVSFVWSLDFMNPKGKLKGKLKKHYPDKC